ncbi:MAG: TonB-dependent receptor [Ignavibacteriales bacterium]|nr:TonB-dependent receptor [Ignavibacteriales bacterium]
MTKSLKVQSTRKLHFGVECGCELSSGIVKMVILLLLTFGTISAQTGGKIAGQIRDVQTLEPLVGVNVLILGMGLGATTDVEGNYFILNVPAGKYDLQSSMIGYQGVLQRDVVVNSNRTTAADFKLKSTVLEQEVVVVQAIRPDVEREKTSTSEIIRFDDVKSIAGMRDVNDILGLAADVTDGHFRGGRSNEEYYTLQGMGIVNPLDASAAFRPIMSAVEEVEVVTSGFGAQYGNAQSGVVNITMKEGKSDKWNSRLETRMRAPSMKYFGPSVYDQTAQPYLQKLADPNFWKSGDASTAFKSIVGWTSSDFGGDSTVMIQVAQAIWKSATSQDINRKYWNTLDYNIEGATGGPLADGVTMFLALRSNVENPIVPTEEPNKQQQVMGNIAFNLGAGAMLRLSGGYQYEFDNILGTGTGFYQWIWDRILGISYRKKVNQQLGLRFSKALSAQSFYEIKVNTLRTENRLGTSPWYDTITDAVRGMETGTAIITRTMNFMFYQNMTGKSFFYLGNNLSNNNNEKSLTLSVDASFKSQVTKSHLLNGGIQGSYYSLDVNNIGSIASKGSITQKQYTGHPFEIGFYAQDKMEFEGMIANVGVRWDLWNSNTEYFVDQFDPFVVRDSIGNPTLEYDADRAQRANAKAMGRLQPRIGISFPVTTSTVFHLNYGTFMQRPSFQNVIGATKKMPPLPGVPSVNNLSNPRLNPQVTNSYDIGVMQGLGEGFTLDVSGYYKDIKDLLEQAVYTNLASGTSYYSYFNRDYADVRGFRISFGKRRGDFTGAINYQFSVATGKSASASNAPVAITKDPSGVVSTDVVTKVPIKDVLLNFDRTHNLILNAAYQTNDEFGPQIWDTYPLSNIIVSVSSFARSGRPYTSPDNATDVNALRSPAEYNTNLKVSKNFKDFFGLQTTFYAEVFNILNDKIFNYNYLFSTANKVDQNVATANYTHFAFEDPDHGVLYWDDQNYGSAYGVDHSFLLYDNAPRSFFFGMVIQF